MVTTSDDGLPRCDWSVATAEYRAYHDQEWGRPVHDENTLFEFLILEGAQAGLSWRTILEKREGYREAFEGFDPEKVVGFTPARIEKLRNNPAIVRNRAKIESTVSNARYFLQMQQEFGGFGQWLWNHVDGKPIINRFQHLSEVPAATPLSDDISRTLKKRGFKFVGSTIMYAFLQATGVVNDHLLGCHCHPDNAAP